MVKVVILLERQRKLCWGSAAICSNCIPGIKNIAMQNQRKLFAFLMLMFIARTEKEEIEYCAPSVGKRKDLSHFPNESDYWTRNHRHHQSLSLSSLSSSSYSSLSHGSKQAMDLLLWRRRKKRRTSMEENQIYTRNTTVFGCLNLTCKIYWLRWTKMGLCSPLDMSGKSSKYRPGLWDFFGVTRETLGNSESTAKDRAVSLFHVHFIPAWHHHLHLTICQHSSPQHCHHHQHHHHVSYWNQCFMEKSIRHWFVTIYLLWILCFLGLLRLLLQDEVSLALCGSDFLSITRWWIAQQLRHK